MASPPLLPAVRRALALDGLDQPGVRDRNRRLVGKRLEQLDVLMSEKPGSIASDGDGPDQLLIQDDRNTEQGSVADDLLCSVGVVFVGQDVGDLLDCTAQRHPSDDRRPVARVRMLCGVLVSGVHGLVVRDDVKEVALRHVELSVLAVA